MRGEIDVNKLKSVAIGLISGSIAVLTLWLTRAVLPPRERPLPAIIKLDTMDTYTGRPSADPNAVLAEQRLLERVVDSFEVASASRDASVQRLAAQARVNIVMDSPNWSTNDKETIKEGKVSVSLKSKTIDQILEWIFRDIPEDGLSEPVWFVRDGAIYIASRGEQEWAAYVLRVYDVRELMLRSRKFSSAFPTTTMPSTDRWDAILHGSEQEAAERLILAIGGGEDEIGRTRPIHQIHYFAGKLLVHATRAGHREVQQRLDALRKVQ
jgi:hypothetical protein